MTSRRGFLAALLGVALGRQVLLLTEAHPMGQLAWRAKWVGSVGCIQIYEKTRPTTWITNCKVAQAYNRLLEPLDRPLRLGTRAAPARDGIDRT